MKIGTYANILPRGSGMDIQAGGPGSGRRPGYGGMKDVLKEHGWHSLGKGSAPAFSGERFHHDANPGHRIDIGYNGTFSHTHVGAQGKTGTMPGEPIKKGKGPDALHEHLSNYPGFL